MIHLQIFTFNDLSENTYVLYNSDAQAILFDPGCYYREEQQELTDFIVEKKLRISYILNTHCHIDHVLGNYFATQRFKAPLLIPKGEEIVLKAVKTYAPSYGFHTYHEAEPSGYISPGTRLMLGNVPIKILSVPGHSPDHVAFYVESEKLVIGGDVLFRESVGRTDLPGGNTETLMKSIHDKLFTLPDDVVVYPGHGPETTIAHEKKYNPFCSLANR